MKRFCAIAVGMAIASLLGGPAKAQNAQQMVGSILITFPIPAGQCQITDRTPAEASFMKKQRQLMDDSKIFLIFTDCAQLERLKESAEIEALTEWSGYFVPNSALDFFYTSENKSRICAAYKNEERARQSEKVAQDTNDKSTSGIKFKEPKYLGVLAEEDNACYTGMLAPTTSEALQDSVRIGVFADVLIKGKMIKYSIVAHFPDSQSVTELLTKHKANVTAFIAANKK